jgi:hypothetical protein
VLLRLLIVCCLPEGAHLAKEGTALTGSGGEGSLPYCFLPVCPLVEFLCFVETVVCVCFGFLLFFSSALA